MIQNLKIIFSNLWHRRLQNVWIFVELVIVTVLTWAIIDPTVVSIHDLNMPLGYDADRIVRVKIDSYTPEADRYDQSYSGDEATNQAYETLRSKAERLPMVEMASHNSMNPDDGMTLNYHYNTGNEAIDTVVGAYYGLNIEPGEKFFSFYGIEAAEGSPSIEELEAGLSERDLIITESVDRAYWPDRRGVKGKRFLSYVNDGDTFYINVAGIVKDFRYRSMTRTGAVALQCHKQPLPRSFTLTLRLADGINADEYIRQNKRVIKNDLRVGNYYVTDIISQREQIRSVENQSGETNRRNLRFFAAALFLINLIVGVVGCVWLQTGKRVAELGVLRSYGASRRRILAMIIGEAVALATIAFAVGDFIYLQYAIVEGLSIGYENNVGQIQPSTWVENFGAHFAIVSAIVYAIIIVCVVIGSYFPARHAANINPVDALRDE